MRLNCLAIGGDSTDSPAAAVPVAAEGEIRILEIVLLGPKLFGDCDAFLCLIVPNAAFWVTLMWGIGLALHIAAYFLAESGFQSRRYERFLAEEKEREAR